MNKVEKKLDVLCLGAAVVDIPLLPVSRDIFDIESYPVEQIAMAVGGDAMNESTIISRLGFKTGLMAAVGDDAAGAFILRSCKKDNIDTEGVTVDPNLNTSINIGLVTADGERTFITNRNGSLWKENIEHVNFDKIKEAKILSLASIFNCPLLDGKTLEKIFKFAKEEGMTITADMIMPRLGETLDDIAGALQYVDYFFPNFDEACLMTGEKEEDKVADKLYSYGIKNVVMKIGKRGCYIRNKDGVMIVPACKGITAIDTIGAGDNFASGFIAALLQGKNLKECGEYANCTAAIAVQHPGATSGVQNREMVEEMLTEEIASRGIGTWMHPLGGYFISFEALEGCAKKIVEKCKEAGVVLTGAGSPYPYKKDPKDSVIRIAPTYPSMDELKEAAKVFTVVVRLVSVDKLLETK